MTGWRRFRTRRLCTSVGLNPVRTFIRSPASIYSFSPEVRRETACVQHSCNRPRERRCGSSFGPCWLFDRHGSSGRRYGWLCPWAVPLLGLSMARRSTSSACMSPPVLCSASAFGCLDGAGSSAAARFATEQSAGGDFKPRLVRTVVSLHLGRGCP